MTHIEHCFYFSFADMDPKELITGREKRELLVEESGKDPVCGILARNIAFSDFCVPFSQGVC